MKRALQQTKTFSPDRLVAKFSPARQLADRKLADQKITDQKITDQKILQAAITHGTS